MRVYCDLLNRFLAVNDVSMQIEILHQLTPFISERCLMEALCRVAMETDSYRLREALIEKLKLHPTKANRCFIENAWPGENLIRRRGALICLGLMGCTTAREVVLEGLHARSFAVRLAAALNTGLYNDKNALEAFERFFEQNRLNLCFNFVREIPEMSKLKNTVAPNHKAPDRIDRELVTKMV